MNSDIRLVGIAGIVGAVTISAMALIDWTTLAVGICEESACWLPTWASAGGHAAGYVLMLPATLVLRERHADAFGRIGRVGAALLPASLVALAVGMLAYFLLGETAVVGVVAGVGFAGKFIAGLVLGIALWRRTTASRLGSLLLLAPFPIAMPLMLGLDALGIVPGHPAPMEAALSLGIATFAFGWLANREHVTTEAPAPAVV